MSSACSRLVVLWAVCVVPLGCWVSPDESLWRSRDADLARDTSDGPLSSETPPGAEAGPDLAPDTKPPPTPLTCTTPEKVGGSGGVAVANCSESALRVDGLELVSKCDGQWHHTQRTAADQPFGDWAATSLVTGAQDPTFFLKGVELAVVSTSPGRGLARVLQLCTMSGDCSPLPVSYEASGQPVTEDMDGASVAVLSDGTVLMAHNIGPSGSASAEIYLAEAVDSNDLSKGFSTSPVAALNQPNYKADDPALSPDGLVLMYGGQNSGPGDYDIWVSEREDVSSPFPPARALTEVNTADGDGSPYLAPLPPGTQTRYELFSSTNGLVYRSECSR